MELLTPHELPLGFLVPPHELFQEQLTPARIMGYRMSVNLAFCQNHFLWPSQCRKATRIRVKLMNPKKSASKGSA